MARPQCCQCSLDQQTLCDWVAAMPEPPGEIRLVHGEPRAQAALARKLNIT
ncbi:MAG: MBL fold metallo-hydrolase RNA specificity domain-containing protein [Desulfobacterium sp.]|nr:MBL fold metallo-hydrolase RNA specificity domain-containing protein [Desulfobacterium sp.]